jgi:hypothetical protein
LRHHIQVLIHQKIYKSKQEAFKMIERYTMSGAFADRLELIDKINSSAQQNQLARTYAKRTIRRAVRRKLFAGFNTWMLHCKWHRRAERNKLKIMKRWKLLELNTAFQTYKSNVKSILTQKALFKRATSRIKYMEAHACLNKWISYVNERCHVRRIVRLYLNKQSKENSTKRLSRGW